MEEVVQTPYGEARARGWEDPRSSCDTRRPLQTVEVIDRFCGQWKKELRDDLLAIHSMAHTVVNGACLSAAPGIKPCRARRIRLARKSANGASRLLRRSLSLAKSPIWSQISGAFLSNWIEIAELLNNSEKQRVVFDFRPVVHGQCGFSVESVG